MIIRKENITEINSCDNSLHDYFIENVNMNFNNIEMRLRYVEKRIGQKIWVEKKRNIVFRDVIEVSCRPGDQYGRNNEILNLEDAEDNDKESVLFRFILSNGSLIYIRCRYLCMGEEVIITNGNHKDKPNNRKDGLND